MIYALILFVVETVTSPVAPWWAGPAYVSALERIVIAIITAFPVVVTQIYYGRNARKDRIEKRAESHREHERGLAAAREREIALAAKVDATALHMADKVEATKAETLAAISENTAMTITAAEASKEAAAVANGMNEKIDRTNRRLLEVAADGKTDAVPPKS